MPINEKTNFPFFEWRVLLEYDPKYKIFVAQCLQTGSVVSADDPTTAEEMIKELLEDEITYAIEHNNVKNLVSSPAPLDVQVRWQKAAEKEEPRIILLKIRAEELKLDRAELETRIEFAAA